MNKKRSNKTAAKYKERQKLAPVSYLNIFQSSVNCIILMVDSNHCIKHISFKQVEQALEDQFNAGRVMAAISSRPGQCGRADGYILEGKELEFYLRKIKAKRGR